MRELKPTNLRAEAEVGDGQSGGTVDQQLPWIDVHCHINMLEASAEESVKSALQQGVQRLITIGTCPDDHSTVLALAQAHASYVYCTLGVHPHEARLFDSKVEGFLRQHLTDPRVVAVGEIGLDYYYNHSEPQVQRENFHRQLELALEFDLPVEIHTRDAEKDTVDILKSYGGQVRGLLHCFTGTQWLADEALALGLNLSFSGVVTFKNAEALRQVVKETPMDRLHVETDSPFLAPVPMRGKKNIPDYVIHVAQKVAELKELSLAELSQQTRLNALKMFPRLQW